MSTKTTFKRIALVTVAALGFGVLTSVAPASATDAPATVGTPIVFGGTTNQAVYIAVPVSVAKTSALTTDTITVSAVLVASPASANAVNDTSVITVTPAYASAVTLADGRTLTGTTSANRAILTTSGNLVASAAIAYSGTHLYTFTPTKPGSYQIAFFTDGGAGVATSGLIKSGDTVKYATVTVADAPAVATKLTVVAPGTFSTTGTNGAVVKVSATDAAGAVAKLNSGQMVTLTIPTGLTLVKKTAGSATTISKTATSYGLVAADFDIYGNAYLNLTSSTAGAYNLTSQIAGGTDSVSTAALTYVAPTKNATAGGTVTSADASKTATAAVGTISGGVMTANGAVKVSSSATSQTYRVYGAALSVAGKVGVLLNDAGLNLWSPFVALNQDVVVTLGATASAATATNGSASIATGTFSIPVAIGTHPATGTGSTFIVSAQGDTATQPTTQSALALTLTGTASIAATSTGGGTLSLISPAVDSILSATGAKTTVLVECVDNFGAGKANVVLTPAITGRNSAIVLPTLVTDAAGEASFSFTDASTSTTSLTDSVAVTGCTTTGTLLTVKYSSAAGFGVSTVKLTSDNMTTAGTANAVVAPQPITVGAAGPTDGARDITATVKDVNAAAIAGVPVTFSVTGSGAAITSTTQTVYTDSTGVATASVYGWIAGTYTITATAGTVSGTTTETFASQTAGNERVISASATGNIVTGKAVDRFGNPVSGVTLYATVTTGDAYFGNSGLKTASTPTLADGTATFVVTGGASAVKVSNVNPASVAGTMTGQTSGPKGYLTNAATNTATVGIFTAYTAGTATTDEEGVGASFDAAGVASATVEVAADAASAQSQAAADAAAEATDAANAATDAANAAAEAADAATAAAQDAADAVAALSAQVASLISGLKSQLTALTNLVIKIQKKVKA
jgi:hypothetical protein